MGVLPPLCVNDRFNPGGLQHTCVVVVPGPYRGAVREGPFRVPCPLEASYQATWGVFPRALKGPIELPPD